MRSYHSQLDPDYENAAFDERQYEDAVGDTVDEDDYVHVVGDAVVWKLE